MGSRMALLPATRLTVNIVRVTLAFGALIVAGFCGGLALMLLLAAPAHADGSGHPDTQAFINALIRDGINPNPTNKSIKMGYRICAALRSGASQDELADYFTDDKIPRSTATTVITDAHAYLCPDAPIDGSQSI